MVLNLVILVSILWLLIILGIANPLSHWDSFGCVLRVVKKNKKFPLRARLRMFSYLMSDLLTSPLHCILWLIDEAIYKRRLDRVRLLTPVFIVSQPRSGSTFLHRLLAEDKDMFFAVTYLEWKWPYICVWKLLDLLRLREWVNNWSYWPTNTVAGRKASSMHPHRYGDHEEHGVFLEEKFYHHYFVFRRFPFSVLLHELADFDKLRAADQKQILKTFERVIRKVSYYRGCQRIWVTKENESVSFYQALLKVFPRARLLFLVRDHKDMLASYITLSRESTIAKIGVDMKCHNIRWHRANIGFRKQECIKFASFYNDARYSNRAMLINYDDLVSNVLKSITEVYHFLQLPMSEERGQHFFNLTDRQRKRTRSYSVSKLSPLDTVGFNGLTKLIEESKRWEYKK